MKEFNGRGRKDFFERQKNDRKDITTMAAHIIRKLRHLSEKQRIVNRIVAFSDCWTSISDLCPKFTALSARDNLRHKKARRQNGLNK